MKSQQINIDQGQKLDTISCAWVGPSDSNQVTQLKSHNHHLIEIKLKFCKLYVSNYRDYSDKSKSLLPRRKNSREVMKSKSFYSFLEILIRQYR